MTESTAGNVRPTSLDDRRRRPRRGSGEEYEVSVVDGLGAGERYGCVFREATPDTASLLVKAELRVGQHVRVQPLNEGVPAGAPIQAEIVRARPLSAGRYDLLIEYRKPAATPKPSESHRRHARKQPRVTRMSDDGIVRSA